MNVKAEVVTGKIKEKKKTKIDTQKTKMIGERGKTERDELLR